MQVLKLEMVRIEEIVSLRPMFQRLAETLAYFWTKIVSHAVAISL